MATTLAPPTPVDEALPLRLWTREEYHRLAATGFLEAEARTELIEGQIYIKMPHGNAHITAIRYVFRALLAAFGEGFDFSMQPPLPLGERNEPQPDVLVLRGKAEDYDGRDPDPARDVALVVEVSDSTLSSDRGAKVQLYATFGVPEYWIVDLRHRTLEVRRRPYGEAYAETLILHEGESIRVGDGTVAVSDVLPKA